MALRIPPVVNTTSPTTITFFLPITSDSRPIGSRNVANIRKYTIETHWTVGRSDENSSEMFGSIMFDAPLSKTVPKIERAPAARASQLYSTLEKVSNRFILIRKSNQNTPSGR